MGRVERVVAVIALATSFHCAMKSECTIEATSYDQSCVTDSDCVGISTGDFCDADQCRCTTAAISVTSQARYNADLARVPAGQVACPCYGPFVSCNHGLCVVGAPLDGGP